MDKDMLKKAGIYILIIISIVFLYHFLKPKEKVTIMSQEKAQTVQGIKEAAEKADVPLEIGQAKQVTERVKEIYTTVEKPVYVVQAQGRKEAEIQSEKAREATGADFSIVATKDTKEEIKELKSLPEDKEIILNQYNVQAYKPVLRQLEYSPDEKVVGFTISKKVANNGQYIGIGADYDMDDKKAFVKVVYTW